VTTQQYIKYSDVVLEFDNVHESASSPYFLDLGTQPTRTRTWDSDSDHVLELLLTICCSDKLSVLTVSTDADSTTSVE